jgi:hypothetical protein
MSFSLLVALMSKGSYEAGSFASEFITEAIAPLAAAASLWAAFSS